jgi:hypothetical protein
VQVDVGIDTLVVLISKIIYESQINVDAEKMMEAVFMVFFSDECIPVVDCNLMSTHSLGHVYMSITLRPIRINS